MFAAICRASSRRYENVQQDHHCAFGRICSWSWLLGVGGDQASSCRPCSFDHHQPEQRWVHGVWWPRMQQRLSTSPTLQATRQLVIRCPRRIHAPTLVRRDRASCSSTVQSGGHSLSFVFCRRWWIWADIAPRIRFLFFCVRNHFNRRFVGAINFFIVFPVCVRAQNISISRQSWLIGLISLIALIRLSGSGPHYQN